MQHFVNIYKIPAVLLLVLLFSCGKKDGNIIPKKELSVIISEMFLADQYAEVEEPLRAKTDTLILYEGIFRKHGYTFEDYRNTIKVYLQDGDALYKIHMKAKDLLSQERERVRKQIALTTDQDIDWWALDTIKKRKINNLWKEPFIRSVKWISTPEKREKWNFTDTLLYDVPHNVLWWENNMRLNITGNEDTLYPVLVKDYLIYLENSKAEQEEKQRKEMAKERRAEEQKQKQKSMQKRSKAQNNSLKRTTGISKTNTKGVRTKSAGNEK